MALFPLWVQQQGDAVAWWEEGDPEKLHCVPKVVWLDCYGAGSSARPVKLESQLINFHVSVQRQTEFSGGTGVVPTQCPTFNRDS